MISIDFYDDLGKLRDSRVVTNALCCDQPIDSAHGITYVYSRDASTAHTNYRGGRMEIYSMESAQ